METSLLRISEAQNKLRLTESERAFALEFFSNREAELQILDQLAPSDTSPAQRFSAVASSLRTDTAATHLNQKALLALGGEAEDCYFKVPRVNAK